MHPDIEEALNGIERLHRKQLAACETLRDLMLEMVRPWRGRLLDPNRPEDALLAALLTRSAKTFWAVIELARLGFGEQGMMLNRSLFEDMVDVHWIMLDPDLAKARYGEHHDHGEMVMFDALAKHPTLYDPADIPTFDPERRKELDGLFGTYGHKSWTGVQLHKRIEAIEHLWTDEREREHLRFFGRDSRHLRMRGVISSAPLLRHGRSVSPSHLRGSSHSFGDAAIAPVPSTWRRAGRSGLPARSA